MPLILQGKFLRALQEREIRRVGDTKSIPIDVRIIAASNSNLEEAVVKGTFRSDLFYRLAVIMIDIPPLRERREDILPLARHFITEEVGKVREPPTISDAAAQLLMAYDWPGNVRELENCMRHALTFWRQGEITPKELPSRVAEHKPAADVAAPTVAALANDAASNASLKSFLRQKEREYIGQILNAEGGDKEKAAERLKVNLSTLYRKLSEEE
jgi:transcriptional regulator with PAS, ATPase and Fis domain